MDETTSTMKYLNICLFINAYLFNYCSVIDAYRNNLYTIAKSDESQTREYKCVVYQRVKDKKLEARLNYGNQGPHSLRNTYIPVVVKAQNDTDEESKQQNIEDPFEVFQSNLHKFLYGVNIERDDKTEEANVILSQKNNSNNLRNYVIGNFMRDELFNNKSGVHFPQVEFLHSGYCELNITGDFMQTAVNAFAIFLYGSIADIERLPADYVLRSARTISMMRIAREKLAATWPVVRAGRRTDTIPHETLELYRPLFKYVTGREIARLNLSDERILSYIGTHPDLNRHQVGVVAQKYIEINKKWSEPKYLNLMNNLLCGVPMTFMRKLAENVYLQLSHQVFYHIRACDPLQRRFYYSMMTKTRALGKPYSWNARDVSRLGLLLAEIESSDFGAINPEAIAGISAQVMTIIPPQKLQYLTELQLKYMAPKTLNILARKLRNYNEKILSNKGLRKISDLLQNMIVTFIVLYF